MQQGARVFDSHLALAVTAFAGYTSVMLTLERQMRRSGGPGIIAFELAGSAGAQRIMSAWGDDGRRAAMFKFAVLGGALLYAAAPIYRKVRNRSSSSRSR